MNKIKEDGLTISPTKPDTKWVALNNADEIIAEGKTPEETMEKAKKISNDFSLVFTPLEGNTYIF